MKYLYAKDLVQTETYQCVQFRPSLPNLFLYEKFPSFILTSSSLGTRRGHNYVYE